MINLYEIPVHENSPDVVNAIVEIPKGTSTKYEYDYKLGVFRLDRCLTSAMVYPTNYGFIPNTLAADGDPLDILIYANAPIERTTLVECTVIGALDMVDDGDKDYKILGVPTSSIKKKHDIHQVSKLFRDVTKNFFQHYKDLSRKTVEVREWLNRETALDIIRKDTNVT
jgi:inorganic pyrophosphatase